MNRAQHLFARASATVVAAVALASAGDAAAASDPIPVNPRIVQHQAQYETARLTRVAAGVYAATAYDYSNFYFLVGDKGIVVVDTGWFQASFERALAELRKTVDKPVTAIIYTHYHLDHIGGGGYAARQGGASLPIYGPAGLQEYLAHAGGQGPVRSTVRARAVQQMGLSLPGIGIPLSGAGVGPVVQSGEYHFAPPTEVVSESQSVRIDGLNINFIKTAVDTPESMMVWLPDQKILIPGDIIGGVLPFIKTARYDPYRQPADMMRAIDLSLELDPDMVLPGHGELLLTKEKIADVLTANRDAIQYLIDQVDRGIINGLSTEQIVHKVHLPKSLAERNDLQPFYVKREWLIRAMVSDQIGFFDNYLQLFRHDGVAEARKFLDIAGGAQRIRDKARQALSSGDPRWALRLVDLLKLANESEASDAKIEQDSLRKLAAITDNLSERYYALSRRGELRGELDWPREVDRLIGSAESALANRQLVGELGARLIAEDTVGQTIALGIRIVDDPVEYNLFVRNQVLRVVEGGVTPPTILRLPRDAMVQLRAHLIGWTALLQRPDVHIEGDRQDVDRFIAVME